MLNCFASHFKYPILLILSDYVLIRIHEKPRVPSGTLLVPREDLLGVFWSSPGALGEALVPTLVGPASQN